ncbi:unnamed protein product [Protopolystoma xenopodis]|uniref:Dynein heavy chain tail domain-containing protein n=1 Tax=Protopolystoma xenopodis TaxID=117903 RepID=A0A3S5BST4_9PLAT|nr:unnamed protein product [Protopolystoma xenopodis]
MDESRALPLGSPRISTVDENLEAEMKPEILIEAEDEFIGVVTRPLILEASERLEQVGDAPMQYPESQQNRVVELIKQRIFLTSYNPDDHWTDQHTRQVEEEFVHGDTDMLIISLSARYGLQIDTKFALHRNSEFTYFVRQRPAQGKILTPEIFDAYVQFGTVCGQPVESLMRVMSAVYAPIFSSVDTWPDSVRNDFALQLQRFMSALTDARWKMENKTVLYMPTEGLNTSPTLASKDKDLVNRFEMIVIHWTRQIKEVLSSQNSSEDLEGAGPMDEIDFWKNRCDNLTGISQQLDRPGIKQITDILTVAKSSYVVAFVKLSEEIKINTQQAQNNLKFLNSLRGLCHDLADASPREIPKLLPRIISRIRMIWTNSDYYNTKEIVTGMFRKLSNEIISRCCLVISLENIFQGKVLSSSEKLNDCIMCCEEYKEIYTKISYIHTRYSKIPWDAFKSGIFAQVDAFIQRCRDLIEARIRGTEIQVMLTHIETMFQKLIVNLYEKKNSILDVKATSWHDEYNRFRSGIKDLEVMMQNTINTAFDTVTTIQQGVEVLDAFAHLQSREAIRRTIDSKTHIVVNMFIEVLNQVKKEMTQRINTGVPQLTESKYSGQAIYWRFLRKRMERSMIVSNF